VKGCGSFVVILLDGRVACVTQPLRYLSSSEISLVMTQFFIVCQADDMFAHPLFLFG
jgi:hypothetical protein